MLRRCEVWGSPIGHSLSPLLHRAAYSYLNLDRQYGAREVVASQLRATWERWSGELDGISVTMPLKNLAAGLGEPDDDVRATGVANTVYRTSSDWAVANTDASAFTCLLRPAAGRSVLLLGGGATATSALLALCRVGAAGVRVVTRAGARPALQRLAAGAPMPVREDVGGGLATEPVLVSTLPARARDHWWGVVRDGLGDGALALDVAYANGPGAMLRDTSQRGWSTVSGRDLLVAQAVDQIRLMVGQGVPEEVLRTALSAGGEPAAPREHGAAVRE